MPRALDTSVVETMQWKESCYCHLQMCKVLL